MLRPSDLAYGTNVHCFRKGYKPMWEEFPDGGCWILRVKKKASRNYLNYMWESRLLGICFSWPCAASSRVVKMRHEHIFMIIQAPAQCLLSRRHIWV